MSPRQAIVVPIAAAHKGYAQEVMQQLWDAGIYAEADLSDVTLNKKIVSCSSHNSQLACHVLTLFFLSEMRNWHSIISYSVS